MLIAQTIIYTISGHTIGSSFCDLYIGFIKWGTVTVKCDKYTELSVHITSRIWYFHVFVGVFLELNNLLSVYKLIRLFSGNNLRKVFTIIWSGKFLQYE